MLASMESPKSRGGGKSSIPDSSSVLSSIQIREISELPTAIKHHDEKDEKQKYQCVSPAAVANKVAQEIDPEIDADIEVMCMIFEASDQSKQEFDTFKEQQETQSSDGTDPIRKTTSTEPPMSITLKLRKSFSRACTMP
jgi:hypothetical protein